VGRTARAGREGTSIVFLERKQVHLFKSMLENIEPDHYKKLEKLEVKNTDLAELMNAFQNSLAQLREEFNKNNNNKK
jgi:superfamily II DNA/RNA helicase